MEPFKNKLSPALVHCIAEQLSLHLPHFDSHAFESTISAQLGQLELKQRAQLIADQIHAALPMDSDDRHRVLRAMLHPMQPPSPTGESDHDGICGWGMMPLCMVVGQHGLEHFEASMQLLREMTSRFTAEFDLRYFLAADLHRALAVIRPWLQDPDPHVRRLVSEGTRPRLPWGMRLQSLVADPEPNIPLLTALRDDDSEYVRRSVANHLNDIAKDHPDRVADITHEWMQGASDNRKKLLRHACRSLIKQGHAHTLAAFGLGPPEINLQRLNIESETVELGQPLVFDATLKSTAAQEQSLVIDYVLHFKKANGSLSAKVFKWKKLQLAAGATLDMRKSHPLRAITTRRYYAGQQQLALRINGEDFGLESFELQIDD